MVIIKGTGRGKCNCGTPTELEMQNIRDASEEAVREAREALRIAGDAQDSADGAQDTLDDIMDGTLTIPEAVHAGSADSATSAVSATNATNASHAANADYATNAGSASIATNLPYSSKRITGTPNDFYVFRYGKIVFVTITGITLARGVLSTFGVGEFPHPLYDSTVGNYASRQTIVFGSYSQPVQVSIDTSNDSLRMIYVNGPDNEYNISGWFVYLSNDPF